jgi:hypothetical protein
MITVSTAAGQVRPEERARVLLDDHVLARLRRDPLVDRDRVRSELEHLDRDLVVPEPHVRVRPLGDRVGRRRVDDRDPLRTRGVVEPLHAREDRLHPVTAERVARAGPGVREVDVDQRRAGAEADSALEAALPVQGGVRREDCLECLLELVHRTSSVCTQDHPTPADPGIQGAARRVG